MSIVVVTLLSLALNDLIGYRVVAFMLLVSVALLAMFLDIIPVVLAAVLSALLWDFLFIPPRFTFSIGTTEDRWLLLMYFVIALIHGVLTYRIRMIQREMRKKEAKANAVRYYNTLLNSLSHELRTPITTIIGAADNLTNNKNLSGNTSWFAEWNQHGITSIESTSRKSVEHVGWRAVCFQLKKIG